MKLGVAGLLPGEWRKIDLAAAQQVRQAGFLGASVFINDPLTAEAEAVRRVRQAFDSAELEVAQTNGWYEALVNPDEHLRLKGIQGLQALCRIGRMLDAPTTYVRPGGLNPHGHWFAHPDNHAPETFDRLVSSLRQACSTAAEEGMILAIEGHVLSVLDSPNKLRDLLDAVRSPQLKVNIDPVNFIGSVSAVHDTRPVLNELFNLLGEDIAAAHAKDCALAEKLVVHIDEVIIGSGSLDYILFLKRLQSSCPDGYILVEHLPDEKIPLARQALVEAAASAGVPLHF